MKREKKEDMRRDERKEGPSPAADPSEIEELRKKAAERDEYYDRWLKVHAEYENTRRRLEKDKSDHMRFANEGIIARLFPIMDNFDMAISAMDGAEDKGSVLDGIKLIQKEFHRVLEEHGVKRIETEGEMFDPNIHEAVFAEETDEVPEGTILEEFRPGYTLNGRLLRPAQVKVAKN
ncbi:MAG: nucleotide exchange factor GrpE [Candidatus Omnitrophica bacterium]|nr:nucleotide exchange factor GrpE [Candidatus Omnitrophota bacterium]